MKTLIDLIKSFAERDGVAMKHDNGYRTLVFSYGDLYEKILQYAQFFQDQGVVKGDKIVLWAPNSPEWVAVYFGIIAAGVVVVPVDMRSGEAHARRIIASAEPRFTVISKLKSKDFQPDFVLENLCHDIVHLPKLECLPEIGEDELVELVYTSGTTGNPKGVMISHKNLLSNLQAVVKRVNVSESDRFLSVLPLSHLLEQTANMLAPLYVGASVVYLSVLKPSAIFKALEKENITIFVVVPRLLQGIKRKLREKLSKLQMVFSLARKVPFALRKKIWFFVHKKFGRSFRFFVSGGAALDADTEEFWNELGFKVVSGYGLTECSPILAANSDKNPLSGSVGRALDNVELDLSENKEILARGPSVFQGYYHDEEKTRESFRDGWFLTGDTGEFDEMGNLFIRGRMKDVIVSSAGVNVYPDDIEAVLNEIEGVEESAVIGLEKDNGEEIHAVLVMKNKQIEPQTVIDKANDCLEESQRIQGFTVWLEAEFPKTSTLKIKKKLVKSKISNQEEERAVSVQGNKLEKILCEVLALEGVKITDDKKLYNDLKLDSIGRLELVVAIEREYGIDFDEENIGLKTRVSDLRQAITEQKKNKTKLLDLSWNYSSFVKIGRQFFMDFIGSPLLRLWCKVEVRGLENLKGIEGPVIFVPNHQSYFDASVIMMALPKHLRRHLATAARDEYYRPSKKNLPMYLWKRFFFYFCALAWGIFPFAQTVNFKKSMEYIGKLVDRGNHVLLFPEGERTWDGKMMPLKRGIHHLIKNLEISVVPVGLSGLFEIFPRFRALPKRGKVIVNFGSPIEASEFNGSVSSLKLENEIEKLII